MKTLKAIRRELRKAASPERAKVSQRFFKTGKGQYGEGDVFLGVVVPACRKIAKAHSDATFSEIKELLKSKYHEERLVALLLLVLQFSKVNTDQQKKIVEFYLRNTRYINNWDLVDLSADKIVGRYLLDRSKAPLHRLVKSNNLWERRIAIMSTFYFIREKQFGETLKLSKKLLSDEHDLIHKAVGWMLREVGNRDRKAEEEFLIQHYRKMPRTMLRYAIEKFPEKRRKAYLNSRV